LIIEIKHWKVFINIINKRKNAKNISKKASSIGIIIGYQEQLGKKAQSMMRRRNFETLMKKKNNSDRNLGIISRQTTINLIEG